MALPKRVAVPVKSVKAIELTKQQKCELFVRERWVHCRFCDFFFEREFPGDDICKNPSCVVKNYDLNNLI